jgi:hypothetical protein
MTVEAVAAERTERTETPEKSPEPAKTTVLEALATDQAQVGPNMSRVSTEPKNTDYDDG